MSKNPLINKHFIELLSPYSNKLPEILKVLLIASESQSGESSCDVEAFKIDANGNHVHFWTGYERYELAYSPERPNQATSVSIETLELTRPACTHRMEHDTSTGNVIRADHKSIQRIEYDPALNKAVRVKLTSGMLVEFAYDSRGDRVRKCVYESTGELLREIVYLRDEQGRCMYEKHVEYKTEELEEGSKRSFSETECAYVYGPRGLVAFVYDDEWYDVCTDHEGSVRLLVHNGCVVAAFDYMPYGGLMRAHGHMADRMRYRFSGKEWDSEFGLYDFHARFYDPTIGRFYSCDPKVGLHNLA